MMFSSGSGAGASSYIWSRDGARQQALHLNHRRSSMKWLRPRPRLGHESKANKSEMDGG